MSFADFNSGPSPMPAPPAMSPPPAPTAPPSLPPESDTQFIARQLQQIRAPGLDAADPFVQAKSLNRLIAAYYDVRSHLRRQNPGSSDLLILPQLTPTTPPPTPREALMEIGQLYENGSLRAMYKFRLVAWFLEEYFEVPAGLANAVEAWLQSQETPEP